MTDHTQQQPRQQKIEKNYIDSLLSVDSQQSAKSLNIDSQIVEKAKTLSSIHRTEITDDSLYQLVSVDGLKLAIPLSEITMVVDHDNSIIKGKLLLHHEEQLTIVSLAELIHTNDKTKDKVLNAGSDNKQFLLIQHRQLAIECHKIHEIESIEKNLVCWRNENSQRKWLAGTVKQLGVAILDMTELQLLITNY